MSLTRHPLQAWSKCAALAGLLLVVGGASARDIPVSNAAEARDRHPVVGGRAALVNLDLPHPLVSSWVEPAAAAR